MPLINLTTDLKSLPYGADRPGGGSSGQPFIVSPLPNESVQVPYARQVSLFDSFYELNRTTSDYPIRGGAVEIDGGTGRLTTPAGKIDTLRIQAFLNDKQKGTIFKLKQTGLQLTNPKMQVPGSIASLIANMQSGFIETTRAYNPTGITTLQQVLTSGTGTHIPRHGLIPDYSGLSTHAYAEYVKLNNTDEGNRLVILTKTKIASDGAVSTYNSKAVDYGISLLNNEILNYPGGPGSVYGIGATIIKRDVNTNTSTTYSTIAYTYDTIQKQETTQGVDRAHPQIQDFRTTINNQTKQPLLATANYRDRKAWYSPANTGDPGKTPLRSRVDYSKSTGNIDAVNYLSPYSYDANSHTPWNAGANNPSDIIKLTFECLDNDNIGRAIALVFRAFITSFTDNNQAELGSFKYMGRGETFRTYQGFDRSINFGFKIAAFSRDEMQPLYTKLNHLVSQIYPDYSLRQNFMRGSIIKLTIGDYLYRVPGFLENVNITVDNNVAWEIALNKGPRSTSYTDQQGFVGPIDPTAPPAYKDNDMAQLPQVLDVQCSFKPIHDFLPTRVTDTNTYVPLIVNTEERYLSDTIDRLPPIAKPTLESITSQNMSQRPIGTRPTIDAGKLNTFPPPPPLRLSEKDQRDLLITAALNSF